MDVTQFSDQFDVLYNNITSNQAPGLNEYEKSVFLTKAQEEIVKNYFNPKANPKQDGFDDSPKRQADFSTIINFASLTQVSIATFDVNSYAYAFPSDLFISLNEQLTYNNTPITVVPVSFEEYDRLMSKPYKYPPKYQAWRLITKNYNTIVPSSSTYYYTGSESDGDGWYNEYPFTLTVEKPYKVTLYIYGYNSTEASSLTAGEAQVTGNATAGYIIKYRRTENQSFTNAIATLNADSSFNVHGLVSSTVDDTDHYAHNSSYFSLSAQGVNGSATFAEVRGRFNSAPTYKMRYVKRPRPIILANLGDMKIHNQFGPSECELPEELHEEILQRAVELAKVAWTATGQDNLQAEITAGTRSE